MTTKDTYFYVMNCRGIEDGFNGKLLFEEKIIHRSEIYDMDEAFICSSAIGVLPCFWEGWKSDYKITKKLQFLLEESLKK